MKDRKDPEIVEGGLRGGTAAFSGHELPAGRAGR